MNLSAILPDAPADPPPLSLCAPGPQGELSPEDTSLSQNWQAKGGHSPTVPRGDRAVEKPPDLSATHSVRELSVSRDPTQQEGTHIKGLMWWHTARHIKQIINQQHATHATRPCIHKCACTHTHTHTLSLKQTHCVIWQETESAYVTLDSFQRCNWVGWKRLLALAISKTTFIKVCQK